MLIRRNLNNDVSKDLPVVASTFSGPAQNTPATKERLLLFRDFVSISPICIAHVRRYKPETVAAITKTISSPIKKLLLNS